jgi:hypothetical protein
MNLQDVLVGLRDVTNGKPFRVNDTVVINPADRLPATLDNDVNGDPTLTFSDPKPTFTFTKFFLGFTGTVGRVVLKKKSVVVEIENFKDIEIPLEV